MKCEYIRDFYNNIKAIIETLDNGDICLKEFPSSKILGYYRKSMDMTTDNLGRFISRGNTLLTMINL